MIAVWFSCGAASAVAAKLTIEKYPDVRVVNNPVVEEDEDNERFLSDVETWLGVKIERATNSKYPSCSARDVWQDRQSRLACVRFYNRRAAQVRPIRFI
jgi:hypothetical protein